jgi:protein-S-isoprenylcysteine O-methyltransferase Ste14
MASGRVEFETAVLPLVALPPTGMLALATARLPDAVGLPQVLGVAVVLAGLGVWLWAVVELRLGGSSTAAPTGELVVSGPFRYSRNPMYVGVVVAVVGQGVAFESLLTVAVAGVVWLAFRWIVLTWEEPTVRAHLGEPYETYCERVPRWLPPFG